MAFDLTPPLPRHCLSNNGTMAASVTTLLRRRVALSRCRCPSSNALVCVYRPFTCRRLCSSTSSSCAATSAGNIHPTRPFLTSTSGIGLSLRQCQTGDAHCVARLDSYGFHVSPAVLVTGRHMLNRQLHRRPFSAGEGSSSSSSSREIEPHPVEGAGVVAPTNKSTTLVDGDIERTSSSGLVQDSSNDATNCPKAVLLKRMMDSAESNLHRMLALADDLFEEEEERHNQEMESDRNGGGGPRRPNRHRRVPLRVPPP